MKPCVIDNTRRCNDCKNPDGYCATYFGPSFDTADRRKVFFIGLDSGRARNGNADVLEWQQPVLAHYRDDRNWNPHYKACVAIAADILGLDYCKKNCTESCKLSAAPCALAHFAQGNAVKCVIPEHASMKFEQKDLIPSCLPLIFEEVALIQPDVIVLQGGGMEDQFYDLLRTRGQVNSEGLNPEERNYSGVMIWSGTYKKSIVVSTHAPAAPIYWGRFHKFMEHVTPRLKTIHKMLSDPSWQGGEETDSEGRFQHLTM